MKGPREKTKPIKKLKVRITLHEFPDVPKFKCLPKKNTTGTTIKNKKNKRIVIITTIISF